MMIKVHQILLSKLSNSTIDYRYTMIIICLLKITFDFMSYFIVETFDMSKQSFILEDILLNDIYCAITHPKFSAFLLKIDPKNASEMLYICKEKF